MENLMGNKSNYEKIVMRNFMLIKCMKGIKHTQGCGEEKWYEYLKIKRHSTNNIII